MGGMENVVHSIFIISISEIVYLPIKPLVWDYSGSTRTMTSLMASEGRITGSCHTCMIHITR